jgi:hypothetical protein
MPATLFSYLKQVRRFLRDGNMELEDDGDLLEYVNQARRETAMRAQCVRILPNTSGAVVSCQVTVPGSGYTNPTVTITPPDFPSGFLPFPNGAQATAQATVIGGQIASVNVIYGGDGYFQPQLSISDPTGSGFAGTLTTSACLTLNLGQEKYEFTAADLSPFPGVSSIYLVRGISVIFSNYRFSLPVYSFSSYQSLIRQYVASQFQYVPAYAAQFGQGTSGSLFLYPPPSQLYQMEWDCQCLPQDLIDDQSVEVIADPWTDAVPYFAAHLSFLGLQNGNTARMYKDLYEERMKNFRAFVSPGRMTNPYGRWTIFLLGSASVALHALGVVLT